MIHYLRIPKSKFWGWVITSLVVGMVLGAFVAYAVTRATVSQDVANLQKQLQTQTSQSASTASALQSQLAGAQASLEAVRTQYESLKSQTDKSTSTSSTQASSSTATQTLAVLSRSVSPSTVATGDAIRMTAKVQGHPDRVTMRIYNTSRGYDETYVLRRVAHTSTTETWRTTATAPKKLGTYRYYATAELGNKSVTKTGTSPGILKVE